MGVSVGKGVSVGELVCVAVGVAVGVAEGGTGVTVGAGAGVAHAVATPNASVRIADSSARLIESPPSSDDFPGYQPLCKMR